MHNSSSSTPWTHIGLPHELGEVRPWIRWIARFGFWAQGFIHLVVGVLAVQLAAGLGGETESLHSALSAIYRHPLGGTLLVVLAAGFLSFAAWKFVQAFWDPDHIGRNRIGQLFRVGFGFGGLIYLGLAYSAIRLVFRGGDSGRQAENEKAQSATATVLAHPWGQALVVVFVIVLVAFAIGNFVHAWRASFRDQLANARMREGARRTIMMLGRIAFSARGLVFLASAWMFAQAAIQADPSEAGGMSKALGALLRQPYGRWLLGAAGGGFIAYGLFSWALIRYRKLPAEDTGEQG